MILLCSDITIMFLLVWKSPQEHVRRKKKPNELSTVEVTQSKVPAQHGQFPLPTQLCHSLNTSVNWLISLIQQREEEITASCWRTIMDSLTMHLDACHYGQTNYKQWNRVTLSLFWNEKKPPHLTLLTIIKRCFHVSFSVNLNWFFKHLNRERMCKQKLKYFRK